CRSTLAGLVGVGPRAVGLRSHNRGEQVHRQDLCEGIDDVTEVGSELADPDDFHTHTDQASCEQEKQNGTPWKSVEPRPCRLSRDRFLDRNGRVYAEAYPESQQRQDYVQSARHIQRSLKSQQLNKDEG